MEKKQTAVQWYFEKQTELDNSFDEQEVDILEYIERKKEIQDQAKQMEKEQIEYFFNCGRQYQLTGEGTFKQVHNETYGDSNE